MKSCFYLIAIVAFLLSACSVTDKFLGTENCTGEVDILARTFETYKYKAQDISPLIEKSGVLKLADKSLTENYAKVTSWIKDIPSLDRVHKEATKYLVSSNSNFLKAVDEHDILNKLEKELSLLSQNASEDEKQAKYLEILSDPELQNKIQELLSSSQQISFERKEFLDKAYAYLSYALIYDADSIGLSSLVVTQGKSQIESIKSSMNDPISTAQKSRCLQKSVSAATDIVTEATQQVTPAVNIYNAIVQLYSDNDYSLPEITSAEGKPITTDL